MRASETSLESRMREIRTYGLNGGRASQLTVLHST